MQVLPVKTEFVGREKELARLVERLDQAMTGSGDAVLIRAGAGAGKSRLCAELQEIATSRGAVSVTGHCLEGGGVAYLPFTEILEQVAAAFDEGEVRAAAGTTKSDLTRIAPALSEWFGGTDDGSNVSTDLERQSLFGSIRDFLTRLSRRAPLLLVIEDAHWADEASTLLLRFLIRMTKGRSILIVVTSRTGNQSPVKNPTLQIEEEVRRQSSDGAMALEELPPEDVARLISGLVGREPPEYVASAFYERVGGNPLFVEQVVRYLNERDCLFDERNRWIELTSFDALPLPDTVRSAIEQRLTRVNAPTVRVLALAAAAGRTADYDLVAEVSTMPPDALVRAVEEGEAAQLISVERARGSLLITFRHDLIRQLVLDRTSLARRQELHLGLASAIESRQAAEGGGQEQALAHHYLASGSRRHAADALRYVRVAAQQAIAATAYEEAARLYAEGLELIPPSAVAERCEMLLSLGEARKRVSDSDLARTAFEEASRLAKVLGDANLYARAALGYARSWPTVGTVDERAVELLSVALEMVPAKQEDLRAQLMSRHALQTLYSGEPDAVLIRAHAAVAAARAAGSPVTLARSLQVLHVAMWQPEHLAERLSTATEIIDIATDMGDDNIVLWGIRPRIADLMELGDLPAAEADINAYERGAASTRQPIFLWQSAVRKAMLAIFQGRLDEGERLAQRALELGRQAEGQNLIAAFGGQLLVIRWQQGRLEELRSLIESSHRSQPGVALWAAVLAFIESEGGNLSAARTLFEELAADRFDLASREDSGLVVLVLCSLVCAGLGDGLRAEQLYERLLPYEGRNIVVSEGVASVGAASLYLGVLSAASRRMHDAERHFRAAIEFNGRVRGKPWLAHAQFELAVLLLSRRRAGDRREASDLLRKALGLARDAGLRRLQERIERVQRSHTRLSSERPDGLTHRECEVLRLVAEGRTTKDISERLVLSERTTARHITNIYAKIGARNRVEASAYALQHLGED
jgi:DNA-binding CsgD family transcriptional regulator